MDAHRFDAIVRTFGTTTRRSGLRLLVSGALSGLLALLGRGEAAAACKNVGQNCDRRKDCCSKKCKNGKCRCRKPGERCTQQVDCCTYLLSICGGPTGGPCGVVGDRCCRIFNAPCTSYCDCCDTLSTCHDGRCCRPLGAFCGTDGMCCSGNCAGGSCAP
jgi:hypothetical protein